MHDRSGGVGPLERLQGLQIPDPPRALRGRTLAATTATLASEVEFDASTRLWSSRGLRLAWMVVVAGLLLAHAALTVWPRTSTGAGGIAAAVSADQLAGELAEIARLPRIEPSALARLP